MPCVAIVTSIRVNSKIVPIVGRVKLDCTYDGRARYENSAVFVVAVVARAVGDARSVGHTSARRVAVQHGKHIQRRGRCDCGSWSG
jgi:hypothetical protein